MNPPTQRAINAFVEQAATAVGHRVWMLRRARGMSQETLARRARSHRPIIGRLERGVHLPQLDVLARVAIALDVTLIDLVRVIEPVVERTIGARDTGT